MLQKGKGLVVILFLEGQARGREIAGEEKREKCGRVCTVCFALEGNDKSGIIWGVDACLGCLVEGEEEENEMVNSLVMRDF